MGGGELCQRRGQEWGVVVEETNPNCVYSLSLSEGGGDGYSTRGGGEDALIHCILMMENFLNIILYFISSFKLSGSII